MTISDIFIIIIRMIIFVAVVAVIGILFSFLSKYSFFRVLGSIFKYALIAIFNLIIITVLTIGLGFITFVLIYLASMYDFFITGDIYTVGVSNITLIFVLIVCCLFIIGTLALSIVPLTKFQFTLGSYSIIVLGTTVLFPVLVQQFHPTVSVSILFAFVLSIVSTVAGFVFFFILGAKSERQKQLEVLRDPDLTYRQKRRRLETLERERKIEKKRAQNLRPAIFPWIYHRKQPKNLDEAY